MQFEINAQARTLQGSGASRRLRRAGKVPGIIYGGTATPQAIEIDHNELLINLKKEAFHASILNIVLDGNKQQVLLRDTQRHAFRPLILHVDFQRVDATTRVQKKVPLHFINEETSPAVKTDKCLVSHVATELEIECLASKLPEYLTVDLGNMSKGQSLHVDDLKLGADVKVVLRGRKNPVIATVVNPAAEEVQPEVVAAPIVKAAPVKAKKTEKQNKK